MNKCGQTTRQHESETFSDCFSEMSGFVSEAVERIKISHATPNAMTGISTGFPIFDELTSGLQRGELIVVAGLPGMGARRFVRSIVMNAALKNHQAVAYLENQSSGKLQAREMLTTLAKINWYSVHNYQIDNDAFARLESAANALTKAPIFYSSFTPTSVQELAMHLRSLSQRVSELELAVVDCFPEINRWNLQRQRTSSMQLAYISRELKSLAEELNIPIILLSPVHRDVEQREDKQPRIEDLPRMGAIANAADVVLFIHRDEVLNPDSLKPGMAEFMVARNRGRGPVGGFNLKFDWATMNFTAWDASGSVML